MLGVEVRNKYACSSIRGSRQDAIKEGLLDPLPREAEQFL